MPDPTPNEIPAALTAWYEDTTTLPTSAELDDFEAWLEANEQVLGDGYQELLNILNQLRELLNDEDLQALLTLWRAFKTAIYIAFLAMGLPLPPLPTGP